MFDGFSLPLNLLFFIGLAALIWQAGTRLSYSIDAIAEQTHIARAFLGLILLATATGLPEAVTTLTAAVQGNATLALNNMFGGMLMQVAVLGLAGIFAPRGTLTAYPHKLTPVVAGLFVIFSASLVLILYMTDDITLAGHVGAGSVAVAALYIIAMYVLQQFQHRDIWSAMDLPDGGDEQASRVNAYDAMPLKKLILIIAITTLAILVCGVLLVRLADTVATQTGLGASFIGVSLLAFTTTMPEISTSIAALRVKAYNMIILNILGSNLIMLFLLFPVDVFYTQGPVINAIDESAAFALMANMMLVALYCIALLIRSNRKLFGIGIDTLLVLLAFFASLFALFHLR